MSNNNWNYGKWIFTDKDTIHFYLDSIEDPIEYEIEFETVEELEEKLKAIQLLQEM